MEPDLGGDFDSNVVSTLVKLTFCKATLAIVRWAPALAIVRWASARDSGTW